MRADKVAVVVAIIALLIAVYALLTQPPAYTPPPTASATVMLTESITVDIPGTYTVDLGWIQIRDAPAVVELSANYTYIWFIFNGTRYGNPAFITLQPGNHTVSAIIVIERNGTKININYRILG
ncbi:MAG: hypothetical protein ACO2PN_14640 [Pyrobaculum sp.]|jgi:hypothetical protein